MFYNKNKKRIDSFKQKGDPTFMEQVKEGDYNVFENRVLVVLFVRALLLRIAFVSLLLCYSQRCFPFSSWLGSGGHFLMFFCILY